MTHQSATFPNLFAVVLPGGYVPPEPVGERIDGVQHDLPILITPGSTFETATKINDWLSRDLTFFDRVVDLGYLVEFHRPGGHGNGDIRCSRQSHDRQRSEISWSVDDHPVTFRHLLQSLPQKELVTWLSREAVGLSKQN